MLKKFILMICTLLSVYKCRGRHDSGDLLASSGLGRYRLVSNIAEAQSSGYKCVLQEDMRRTAGRTELLLQLCKCTQPMYSPSIIHSY